MTINLLCAAHSLGQLGQWQQRSRRRRRRRNETHQAHQSHPGRRLLFNRFLLAWQARRRPSQIQSYLVQASRPTKRPLYERRAPLCAAPVWSSPKAPSWRKVRTQRALVELCPLWWPTGRQAERGQLLRPRKHPPASRQVPAGRRPRIIGALIGRLVPICRWCGQFARSALSAAAICRLNWPANIDKQTSCANRYSPWTRATATIAPAG